MEKLKFILYTLYCFVIVYLVFMGGGNDTRQDLRLFRFDKGVNFIPFTNKILFLTHKGEWYDNDWFYFYREITGNMLLLFPVPFFLIWIEKYDNWKKVLWFCFCITFGIEFSQFLLNIGQADIDDLILNLVGATLATLTAFKLKYFFVRHIQHSYKCSN